MTTDSQLTAQEKARLALAERVLADRPERVRAEYRESVLSGTIMKGMTPYEAKLAGGAFTYKVRPDETVWQAAHNPLEVMWAQAERPDASFIRMSFSNRTQFQTEAETLFSVIFDQGRAQEIKSEGA